MTQKPIHSMTGFSSIEAEFQGTKLRIEAKALNHRFLDIKVRLPREFSSAEMPLRALIQSRFTRGSLDFKVERISEASTSSPGLFQLNLAVAAHYYESLTTLQKTLGLTDSIQTRDIIGLPEVVSRGTSEFDPQEAWAKLES